MVQNKYNEIILSIACLSAIFALLFWGAFTNELNFEWIVFSILVATIVMLMYHLIFKFLAAKYDYVHTHEFVGKGALISLFAALFHMPVVTLSREQLNSTFSEKYVVRDYDKRRIGYVYLLGNEIYLLFLLFMLLFQGISSSFFEYLFLGGMVFSFWQIAPVISLTYIKIKGIKTPFLRLFMLYGMWLLILICGLFQIEYLLLLAFFIVIFDILLLRHKLTNL